MDQERLHRALEELHGALRAAKPVDAGNRELLERLAQEIRQVLDRKGSAATPEAYRAIRPRLQEAVSEFEASHPQLSRAITNVVDTLAIYNL